MYSKNLTTGVDIVCALNNSKHENLADVWSITMDDGKNLYYTHSKKIYRLPVVQSAGGFCPTGANDEYQYPTSNYNPASQIEIDPQDANTLYVTSEDASSLQKLTISADKKTLTQSLVVGGSEKNKATPASAANENESSAIAIYRPQALYVGNDRVWTGGKKISIQEYDISGNNIKWKAEMGTTRLNRMKGAQTAIEAVVTDSAFLQTARLGTVTGMLEKKIVQAEVKLKTFGKWVVKVFVIKIMAIRGRVNISIDGAQNTVNIMMNGLEFIQSDNQNNAIDILV